MIIQKSQVKAYIQSVFDKINGQRYLSMPFFSGFKSFVVELEKEAIAQEDKWTAGIPDSLTPVQAVDTMILWAEDHFKGQANHLAMFKLVVDAIMTAIPGLS